MKIVINTGGSWDSLTMASNLSQNYLTKPIVRDIMEYTEKRSLVTLIAAGVEYDGQIKGENMKRTKIGVIPDSKLIAGSRYDYQVMGRIEQESIIVAQVGTSQTTGEFTAQMFNNLLYVGVICRFYTGRLAIVQSYNGGSAGNYIYTFKTMDAQVFTWATEVTVQPGQKTCFGVTTAYGEASKTSGSNNFAPSTYAGFLSIQRTSGWITGDAMAQVTTMYGSDDKKKEKPLGWDWTQVRQAKAAFMMQDEFAKWDGESTMRDANGVLLTRSLLQDAEGKDVITGDGIIPQLRGANDMAPSGADGMPTLDDYKDMMGVLSRNADMLEGNVWYVVSGSDGFAHNQDLFLDAWNVLYGGRTNVTSGAAGSGEVVVGANFHRFEYDGNVLIFVKNVGWDDPKKYPQRTAQGKSVKGSSFVFLNNGFNDKGQTNIEILAKGQNGINRAMVTNYIGGLTGVTGMISQSSVDAQEFNILKQNGVFVYNTQACGLMEAIAA
jgi:hypothetical protein